MIEKPRGSWVRVDSFEELEIDDLWRRIEEKEGMDSISVYFEKWIPDLPYFRFDRAYLVNNGAEVKFGADLNQMVLNGDEIRNWEPLYRHHEHHTARLSVEEANAEADEMAKALTDMKTVPQGGETVAVLALNAQQRDNLLVVLAAIHESRIPGLHPGVGPWWSELAVNLGYKGEQTNWGSAKYSVDELAVLIGYAHDAESSSL